MMKKAFLEYLAEEIRSQAGEDPGKICVVLPNRRAGLFLKKYLAGKYKKTIWAPEIYSIEDFFVKISGYQLIDQVSLLFELYRVHLDLNPTNPQDFEAFSPWGQVLLNDFNELDLYLADPQKIFNDISEARALTVWNLGEKPLTPFEENYINFYRSLLGYYKGLEGKLLSAGYIYKGLAHRIVADTIHEKASAFTWEKVFFAGLNALSKSEEMVIRYLYEMGIAQIFWDADHYYLDDSLQEAGDFIRNYLKVFPQEKTKWISEHFKDQKEILVTGIPGNTGQSNFAGHLLRKTLGADKGDLHRTAIVLADEKLLLPVLNALPQEASTFNITMGYALRLTPVYHFFHLLFRLHLGSERIRKKKDSKESYFYARDIILILSSPYLAFSGGGTDDAIERLKGRIFRSGRVIYGKKEIMGHLEGLPQNAMALFRRIFSVWGNPATTLEELQSILEALKEESARKKVRDLLEMEYFYHFARVVRKVKKLLQRFTFIHSLRSLEKAFFQMLDSYAIPFYGEPLEGIQIMGVLETRAIDFDKIIILSVNEGILPAGRAQYSFIPYDIKKDYSLPTHREKDSIFAYHFYRLLQRAGEIHLLYDTEGTQLGGGEKSRFITQLLYELPRYNKNIKIEEKVISSSPVSASTDQGICFKKSRPVRQKLLKKAEKGFSPTALNTYIQCPLKFYFNEIAGLSETEEIEETIEARTLGEVIHYALENLFKEFAGKYITANEVASLATFKDDIVEAAFKAKYPEGDIYQGKNLLIYEVSKQMVHQLLKQQASYIEELQQSGTRLKILALEDFFHTEEEIEYEGNLLSIHLKGKIDRVDQEGDRIHIIDYKTGNIESSELNVRDWESLITDPKNGKAFQLLLYSYMYYRTQAGEESFIESGNISLRAPSKGFIKVRLPGDAPFGEDSAARFSARLKSLLQNIFDPETGFTQTKDIEQCTYCTFKGICCR